MSLCFYVSDSPISLYTNYAYIRRIVILQRIGSEAAFQAVVIFQEESQQQYFLKPSYHAWLFFIVSVTTLNAVSLL